MLPEDGKMSTKTTTVKVSATGASRQANPHIDLRRGCSYFTKAAAKEVPDGEKRWQLAETAKRMLNAESKEERVAAARELLSGNECGLAYTVLAREDANSTEQQEEYYRKALALLRDRSPLFADDDAANAGDVDHDAEPYGEGNNDSDDVDEDIKDIEPYFEDPKVYLIVATEFARFLWTNGKADEAMSFSSELTNRFDYAVFELAVLSISWHIQEGKLDVAQSLLSKIPIEDASWYLLQALMLFGTSGDTTISRAALRAGLINDFRLGKMLLGMELDEQEQEKESAEDHQDSCHAGLCRTHRRPRYIADTGCAWHKSPGADEWLETVMTLLHNHGVALAIGTAGQSVSTDRARLKRWRDNFDIGRSYMTSGDYKQARKLLRSALREAEMLGTNSAEFEETLRELEILLEKAGGSSDETLSIIEKRLQVLEGHDDKTSAAFGIQLRKIAKYFKDLHQYERATELFLRCREIYDTLIDANSPEVSLFDTAGLEESLGVSAGEQRQYQQAADHLQRAIEQKERYLTKDHGDLAAPIDRLWRCLHHLGNHAEEAALKKRLEHDFGINIDNDEHSEHGPSCPWFVKECRAK
jgi:tetratricopeptide (TPR) repeat protein